MPTSEKAQHKDLVNRIMDYEENLLTEGEEVRLFQDLIDSGIVWQIAGSFGRTANILIEKGLCNTLNVKEGVRL